MSPAADQNRNPLPDSAASRVEVITSFSGYEPPFDPVPIVERMIASVPSQYLLGLKQIVLTNSSGLPRKRRRAVTRSRKRKVKIVEAKGLYHQAWNGKQAWVEVFLDNVLERFENHWAGKLGFLREAEISDVLFHEIGHHIHFTVRPEHREKEDVADVWKVRLGRIYLRQRHPLLRTVQNFLRPIIGPLIRRFHHRAAKKMLAVGAISQAEFDEEFMKDRPRN
jgi:hypothetical protein